VPTRENDRGAAPDCVLLPWPERAVAPGGIKRGVAHDRPDASLDAPIANIPLGDFGQPEDLGPLAVYLASDASRYMTGSVVTVDGGFLLN